MAMSDDARPSGEVDRTADGMFRNYDEARNWVEDADLRSQPVVLEDHYKDEHVATCRVTGGNDRYTLEITNHEGADTTRTSVVDGTEVAEMMGGWKVAGRLNAKESENA